LKSCFHPADILFPKEEELDKWAVIACDQFSSEPEYWNSVRSIVGNAKSTLHMILPEAELTAHPEERITQLCSTMQKYLDEGVFAEYEDAFVYVERTLLDGKVRKGLVGAIDLDACGPDGSIRATERTVAERVPPRVAIRHDAPVEFPHVQMLCNDFDNIIFGYVESIRDRLPRLYDFELMEDGGRIQGWLIQDPWMSVLQEQIQAYCDRCDEISIVIGDGNHSVVAAQVCHQERPECDNARYMLVELLNLHDEAVVFEPIHRVIKNTDVKKLLKDIESCCSPDGTPIRWYSGNECGQVTLDTADALTIAVLQDFLDRWLAEHPGEADYIHGDDSLIALSSVSNSIGFLLPGMEKEKLFPYISNGQLLPRKAFSLGHAREKRYYLEGKKIL